MPNLRRTDTKLLRTVNHKPHATQDDHHDVLPTPPATNITRSSGSQTKAGKDDIDTDAEPLSTDDEQPEAPTFSIATTDGATGEPRAKAMFKKADTRSRTSAPEAARPKLEMANLPNMRSPESTRSKRSNESDGQQSSDGDAAVFSSQISFKKAKTANTGQTGLVNFHAPERKPKTTYARRGKVPIAPRKNKNADKAAKAQKKPVFAAATGLEAIREMADAQAQAAFALPEEDVDSGAANSLSPSLSSLSSVPDSPGVEEIQNLELPAARPYCATVQCAICEEDVDKIMKEMFEDQYTNGKSMSFKWQERFCAHHRRETAKATWKERGYPEIDWDGLQRRMREFDERLRDVIHGRVASEWKQELRKDVRPSKAKAVDVRAKMKTTAWVGYYGPRGERVMTEHIVAELGGDLREQASKDKLVAASGVKGGVSGFVHGVLVPELACRLVAEDMKITAEQARRVVEESVDVGILVHPEVDEDVRGGRRRWSGRDADDEAMKE